MIQVPLIRPYIQYGDIEAEFREIFASGIFTRGKFVEGLRNELAAYLNVQHVHLATSATTALWVCLKLLGVGPGDEVIVADFSFPATANVVEDLGAVPRFADVSRTTFNMRPDSLRSLLGPKTKAVIFVDALGNPTGLSEIQAICAEHGVPLIEDAACAIGSAEDGNRCGSQSDLACFSFHPRKLICTGEGGAITTNRADWAAWFDVKLAHGAQGVKGIAFDFVEYGYNFRLPELQAVMASRQLERLDQIIDERNAVRNEYRALLEPLGFVAQSIGQGVRSNLQSMVFAVPERYSRDQVIAGLKSDGIESTLGTYCLSATSYYSAKYAVHNPNAAWLEQRSITLPCYAEVDVERVVASIRKLCP